MTLLMLIMLFVFVPNRLCCALAVSLVGALFTLAMVSQSRSLQTREFVVLSLVLALPIVTGYVSAWRVQMLQRQQYALLMAARASNDQLRQEVEQRRALQEALRIQASIDPLTGLNNRREYEKLFSREMARARREGPAGSAEIVAVAQQVRTETPPFRRTEARDKLAAIRDALPPEDRPWRIRDFVLVDPSGVLWRVGQNIGEPGRHA